MSSGMNRDFRYWRKELSGNLRRMRMLARRGDCLEAKRLYADTLQESSTSLIGWDTWGRVRNDIVKYCGLGKRSKKRKK